MSYLQGKIGDYVTFSNGRTSPERTSVGEVPVYGSNGVIGYTRESNAPAQTTIIGRVGTYCGSLHFSHSTSWVTDNAIRANAKEPEEARYWHYALVSADLNRLRSGSGQPLINQRSLNTVELWVPSREVRLRIGCLLGSLDDKIELNRRMNETLEAMAQAIFRDWFVDFGPTRRKIDGATDPVEIMGGLVADPERVRELAELFPGSIGNDGLPEGWSARPIGELATLRGGKQLAKQDFAVDGTTPVFGGAGKMGFTDRHNAEGYVITVGRVGAYCGQFFAHRGKAWVNNNASLIVPTKGTPEEWLFLALRELDIDTIRKGAAQPFVSNSDIAALLIVHPGYRVLNAFQALATPLIYLNEQKVLQCETLAATRDLLLPKLMSGEVRLDCAREQVEEAT